MEGKGKTKIQTSSTQLQKDLLYTLLLVLKDKSSPSNVAERQYFGGNAALPRFPATAMTNCNLKMSQLLWPTSLSKFSGTAQDRVFTAFVFSNAFTSSGRPW